LTLAVVIPYKGRDSKSRLAERLTSEGREELSRSLLDRVLLAVNEAQEVSALRVISPHDIDGVDTIRDGGTDLNRAIALGIKWALHEQFNELLVLPADLAYVGPADIVALLTSLRPGNAGVVAPSKDGGTGALLMRPPNLIQPAFGRGSATRHLARLRAVAASMSTLYRPGLSLDIDTSADLAGLEGQLLDVVRSADRYRLRTGVDRGDEPTQDTAGTNLDEAV